MKFVLKSLWMIIVLKSLKGKFSLEAFIVRLIIIFFFIFVVH